MSLQPKLGSNQALFQCGLILIVELKALREEFRDLLTRKQKIKN